LGIAQRSFSDYTFTKVTDSLTLPTNNLNLASIDPLPQINNSRQIALGFRGNQQQSMAIYRWESGTYTRIVGSGDSILGKPPVFSLSPPVISNSGSIAFEALFVSSVAINDLGNVLFSA